MKKKNLSSGEEQISIIYFWWVSLRIWLRKNIVERFRKYRARRPHRSFRLTRRRDYIRPLEIGGYWKNTGDTLRFIRENKRVFRNLVLTIMGFSFLLIGLLDGNFLSSLQSILDESNKNHGNLFGEVGKAGLLVLTTFTTGGLVRSPNDTQRVAIAFIVIFVWLAVVQICRNILAGNKKNSLRDALYSCGGPIIPMIVIVGVIFVQLIPAFIATILFSASRLTNFMTEGIENALFMSGALLLISISVYWVMGSLFAMILTTIPGTYPFQALKISGDIMSQRRLKIFKRIVWLVLLIVAFWMIVLVPLILLVNLLAGSLEIVKNIPFIQIAMLGVTSVSLVFAAVYIYLLYRKIVDAYRR
ncbi:MAG: hypothetical protein Q4A21_02500 [bacterium]|nr:hypothetical protein [bacterium]